MDVILIYVDVVWKQWWMDVERDGTLVLKNKPVRDVHGLVAELKADGFTHQYHENLNLHRLTREQVTL